MMPEVSQELAEVVCPCASVLPGRVYPVERPGRLAEDGFSSAVVRDVAEVLSAHGFPPVEDDSPDWYALTWCLWRFVYGYAGRGRHGSGSASAGPDTDRPGGGAR